jgi:hypothetical protein
MFRIMPAKKIHASPAERQRAYRQRLAARQQAESVLGGVPLVRLSSPTYNKKRWDEMLSGALFLVEMVRDEMWEVGSYRTERWFQSKQAKALFEQRDYVCSVVRAFKSIEK